MEVLNHRTIFSQFIITMCNFLVCYPELKNEQFLEMCVSVGLLNENNARGGA